MNDYVASKRCKLICSGVDAVVEKLEENFFSKDVGAAAAAATSAGRSGVVGKGKGKPKIAKIKIKVSFESSTWKMCFSSFFR